MHLGTESRVITRQSRRFRRPWQGVPQWVHFELLGFYKSVRVPLSWLSNKISSPTQHQYVSKDILGERIYGCLLFCCVIKFSFWQQHVWSSTPGLLLKHVCHKSPHHYVPIKSCWLFFDFIFPHVPNLDLLLTALASRVFCKLALSLGRLSPPPYPLF